MNLIDRCAAANEVIQTIASTGRRFFWSPAYERTSRFDLDHVGACWYIDHHTGMKLYPLAGRWTGFTGEVKAKGLIFALAEFIESGRQVSAHHFPDEGWGYGAAMAEVKRAVLETKAVAPKED